MHFLKILAILIISKAREPSALCTDLTRLGECAAQTWDNVWLCAQNLGSMQAAP